MSVSDGEVCPYCGEAMIEGDDGDDVSCPNCGGEFVIGDDDDFGGFEF
ncbi:MAG: Prokaryotic finger family 1 [Actinomycetota bacterium]|jgi:uncharacterized Zn finger protein (UPF0148 family)